MDLIFRKKFFASIPLLLAIALHPDWVRASASVRKFDALKMHQADTHHIIFFHAGQNKTGGEAQLVESDKLEREVHLTEVGNKYGKELRESGVYYHLTKIMPDVMLAEGRSKSNAYRWIVGFMLHYALALFRRRVELEK